MNLDPYTALIKLGVGAAALVGIFLYGMHVGASRVRAADSIAHAKQLSAVVAALEQQAADRDADNLKLKKANDNAQSELAAAMQPIDAPDVRLCYYAPAAAGGHQVPETAAVQRSAPDAAAPAEGLGPAVHGGDHGLRAAQHPNIGPLLFAFASVLDATSAIARGERAAGR